MKQEPLNRSHQSLLTSRFQQLAVDLSEYSFANCYLFRHVHEYEVIVDEEEIFLRGKTYDGKRYLMPTRDIRLIQETTLKRYLQSDVDFLFPIPEKWVTEKQKYSVTYLDQESDYIYDIEKIRNYPGRHLDGRRNLVHQFLNEYRAGALPLSGDALQVLEKWTESNLSAEKTDDVACREAIALHQELGLTGRLYIIDGKPAGFIIGEALNEQMFVLHFAKADLSYKGIYQYMYQEFAQTIPENIKFLNWEQDLGIAGLQQSKNAYLPDRLLKKMRVSLT